MWHLNVIPQISIQYVRYGSINELYSISKVDFCKTFLALHIIPRPLAILFLVFWI